MTIPPASRPAPTPTPRIAVGVLCVMALLLAMTPARAANNEEQRIAETREALREVREELDSARSEAESDQIDLADADRQLEAAFAAVDAAQQAVQRQQDAVTDAERRLADAQTRLIAQQQLLAARIADIYRQQRPDPLLQVFDASSLSDAVRQTTYIRAIGRRDRAAIEGLANAETEVDAQRRVLEVEQVALEGVLREQQALFDDVEALRNDRALIAAASEDLVARLQSRESHLQSEEIALAAEIRRQQAAAAAAIAAEAAAAAAARQVSPQGSAASSGGGGSSGDSPAPAPAPAPPPPSGGGFTWPASGTVTSEFGPRWGRNHNGIDIANGVGSAIVAARGGTVGQAGSIGSGFGNGIVIYHSGGFATVYAHLSSVAVSAGQSVSTGQYIGAMGCSGSCTGPHLHFEIHANGAPVNPRAYL